MKLKRVLPILLLGGVIMTLAACSTHKNKDQSAINEANAAYASDNAGARSSGLGEEEGFGEEGRGGSLIAKRTYYFDYDSNVVHEQDKPAIAANADYLMSHANAKAIVEGHTDPRGSREYNIGLGERRARAVANIMIAQGVNPAQLRIVSYGAEKLAASGRSEAAYQRDRRVVLVYLRR